MEDTLKTRIAREDGHESKLFRWDFKPQTSATNVDGTSFATFLEYFQKDLWPEFVEHHDLAVWYKTMIVKCRSATCLVVSVSQSKIFQRITPI